MMETICQELQLSMLVTVDSDWLVPVRDSVREMVAGLERHPPAKVKYMQLCELVTKLTTHFYLAIICPKLDNPDNGRVVVSGLTPSSIADYTCDKGFKLIGTSWRKCLDNGEWSGEAPVCKRTL